MSSRYHHNNYFNPSYSSYSTSPYRSRSKASTSSSSYYYSKGSSSSSYYNQSKPSRYDKYEHPKYEKSKPRSRDSRERESVHSHHNPGPYSPSLGRKKSVGHWKAKRKPSTLSQKEEEERKTKLGEFNQETIEAELNRYKKGVFYHDDKAKKKAILNKNKKSSDRINGEHRKPGMTDKQYSQYQLTRTRKAAPQVYDDSLPRAVPPDYDERIKSNDNSNDDKSDDDKKEREKSRKNRNHKTHIAEDTKRREKDHKKKRKSSKKSSSSSSKPMVTVSPSRLQPMHRYPVGPPMDPYYYGAGAQQQGPQPFYYGATAEHEMYAHNPYNPMSQRTYDPYSQYYAQQQRQRQAMNAVNPYGTDRGFRQSDGSWYPYPEVLQQQQMQQRQMQQSDPLYVTPKRSKKDKKPTNVDLTTPLNASKESKANKSMSPGRRVNKIQKQLEYYFSPSNMERDEFLRESMDKMGWVRIEVICGFNRMKVLGANKELVVEAAFHSTSIEIDGQKTDRIRMTKMWRKYVEEKNKKKEQRKRRKDKEREKELDNAEINPQTIESIVAGIQKKHEKRKKRRDQKEQKKHHSKEDKDVDDKKNNEKNEEEEDVKALALIKKDKAEQNENENENENEDPNDEDMVDID